MSAQAGLAALYLPRRPGRFLTSCWQSIALLSARHRNLAFPLTLGASALAGMLVTTAILDEPIWGRQEAQLQTARLASLKNETLVYQQARPAQQDADQDYSQHPSTEQIEASDQLADKDAPSISSLQIARFDNPGAPTDIGIKTPVSHETIREALIKIGGFVAFRPKEEDAGIADDKGPTLPRNRTGSIMDEVDDYLWEIYQRIPIKKDGTGDFTWKDPAAAKQMGLSLQDYVIGGMDPEFREQLYHAGRAMDAAGLQWSMLSAFRDDYRQGLASGYKAGVSNSLHGGSRRTGGYGHGRAIDITGPEGRESEVWKWIDDHGVKYGLHRPLPKPDPAHVQQRGDWHNIALALRESRTRSALGDNAKVAVFNGKSKAAAADGKAKIKAKSAATDGKAKIRKTAVASAR